MKLIQHVWMACIGLCLFSCTQTDELETAQGKTGFIVSLTDGTKLDVSRATPGEIVESKKIEGTDFDLKIVNAETKEIIYNDKVSTGVIEAYSGVYDLTASYGTNPILELDAPYFEGETKGVEVFSGRKPTPVTIACKVANALVSVTYDNSKASFDDVYSNYYVEVKVGSATPVQIDKTGEKSAYMQAGSAFEVIFHGTIDGTDKAVTLGSEFEVPATLNAGDHLKLTLSPKLDRFDIPLNIESVAVETATLMEEIPMKWLPKPKIEAEGFTNNELSFVETEQKNAKLKLTLSSALQDIKFKFDFEDEQFADVFPKEEYLLSNADDKQAIETALGITLPAIGATEASIDLSALVSKLQTNAGTTTNNAITLDAKANDRWSSEDENANLTYTLACNKPEFSVSVQPENCWSWEFTVDEVTVTSGDADKIKSNLVYQYYNGTDWVDCSDGMTQKFAVDESRKNVYLTDTPEARTYPVRALYRGAIASTESTAILEEPWQLPNGNMDEWTDLERYNQPYYLPWGNNIEQWWDTNNNETMPDSYRTYPNYKCFPTTTYTNSSTSGKAAEIRSVAINSANSEIMGIGSTRGVLYAGITDNDGKMTEGRDWNSRPSKVAFMYKYDSQDNEHFGAYFELFAEDGTSIVSGNFLSENGQDVSTYTKAEIPLQYSNTQLKAATIKIRFVSVADGESVYTGKQDITIPAGSYKIYGGSVLTIDDIELVYDK